MSEYQYYEFQAIDRPLTEREMEELRRYSTRAVITPTSFTNEYNWGDFKGNPREWIRKYFDAFFYFANWGTRTLLLKIPVSLLSSPTADQYCVGESCWSEEYGESLIVGFNLEGEDDEDFYEDPDWSLASLLPVRNDLCRGDLRGLYLGWLRCALLGELDDDEIEPPVPPNLRQLSPALETLADFLVLDPDLVSVAAQTSPALEDEPDLESARGWIAALPVETKDEMLLRVMEGRGAHVGNELWARMKRDSAGSTGGGPADEPPRRTVGELLKAAEHLAEERRKEKTRKAAEDKARRQREAAEKRKRHLDALTGREAELWAEVHKLIAMTQPKPYEQAISLLIDLRDLAQRASSSDFSERLAALRLANRNKPSLLERLKKAGLFSASPTSGGGA